MLRCRAAAEYLVSVLAELATADNIPRTVTEARTLLAGHQRLVETALQDDGLRTLQDDGQRVMDRCRTLEDKLKHSEDYRRVIIGSFHDLGDSQTNKPVEFDGRVYLLSRH